MNKTENKTEGLILYSEQSDFSGDVTKNCGLTGKEIDNNFLFLRKNDIYEGEIKDNEILLKKGNGEIVTVTGLNISENEKIENVHFNSNTNTLVIETTNKTFDVTGFSLNDIFSITTIKGDGTINNPLRLNSLYKSSFLSTAKTLVDLTIGETIDKKYQVVNQIIVTKEKDELGKLYNYSGVTEIENALATTNTWRIPNNNDWGEMLNALELCEPKDHLIMESGEHGTLAGAFLKSDGRFWRGDSKTSFAYGFKALPCGVKSSSYDENNNFGKVARFWSSTVTDFNDALVRELNHDKNTVGLITGTKNAFYSLRLVRDYNNNYNSQEVILGSVYDTVKMPYIKLNDSGDIVEKGVRIWTSVNVNYETSNATSTNVKDNIDTFSYYINYWNGDFWEKRVIEENDIVIIEDRDNREYKLINGELKLYSFYSDLSNYYTREEIDSKNFLSNKDYSADKEKLNIHLNEIKNDITTNNNLTTGLQNSLTGVGIIVGQKYEKPVGGIPMSDLNIEVQTRLNLAQNALQAIPSEYVTETELKAKGYLTSSDISNKQDVIDDLEEIRKKANSAIQEIPSDYITQDYLTFNYLTETEVNALIDNVTAGDIELANYYTKAEVNNLVSGVTEQIENINETITSLTNTVSALTEEINYLKTFLNNILDTSLYKNDGSKYTDDEMKNLTKLVKFVEPSNSEEKGLNEITTIKSGSTIFIDFNSNVGNLIEME